MMFDPSLARQALVAEALLASGANRKTAHGIQSWLHRHRRGMYADLFDPINNSYGAVKAACDAACRNGQLVRRRIDGETWYSLAPGQWQ